MRNWHQRQGPAIDVPGAAAWRAARAADLARGIPSVSYDWTYTNTYDGDWMEGVPGSSAPEEEGSPSGGSSKEVYITTI